MPIYCHLCVCSNEIVLALVNVIFALILGGFCIDEISVGDSYDGKICFSRMGVIFNLTYLN